MQRIGKVVKERDLVKTEGTRTGGLGGLVMREMEGTRMIEGEEEPVMTEVRTKTGTDVTKTRGRGALVRGSESNRGTTGIRSRTGRGQRGMTTTKKRGAHTGIDPMMTIKTGRRRSVATGTLWREALVEIDTRTTGMPTKTGRGQSEGTEERKDPEIERGMTEAMDGGEVEGGGEGYVTIGTVRRDEGGGYETNVKTTGEEWAAAGRGGEEEDCVSVQTRKLSAINSIVGCDRCLSFQFCYSLAVLYSAALPTDSDEDRERERERGEPGGMNEKERRREGSSSRGRGSAPLGNAWASGKPRSLGTVQCGQWGLRVYRSFVDQATGVLNVSQVSN